MFDVCCCWKWRSQQENRENPKTMIWLWEDNGEDLENTQCFYAGFVAGFLPDQTMKQCGITCFSPARPIQHSLSNFKSSLAQVKSSPSTQTRAMDSLVVRHRKWNLNRHSCTWHQKWESLAFISPCCQTILANLAQNRPHVLKLGL
jgi:hypothetical protein